MIGFDLLISTVIVNQLVSELTNNILSSTLHINLRQMHLYPVMWQRCWSCCSIRQKLHATCNLHGSIFHRSGVNCPSKFYIVGRGNVALFCCCDIDLDLMTCKCYPLEISLQAKNDLSTARLLKVIIVHTDIHTYIQTENINTLLCGW